MARSSVRFSRHSEKGEIPLPLTGRHARRPIAVHVPVRLLPSDPKLPIEVRALRFVESNAELLVNGIKHIVPGGEKNLALNSEYGIGFPKFSRFTYLGNNLCNVASLATAVIFFLENPEWDLRVVGRKVPEMEKFSIQHIHLRVGESTEGSCKNPIIVDPSWRGLMIVEPPRSILHGVSPVWQERETGTNRTLFRHPFSSPIYVGRKDDLVKTVQEFIESVRRYSPKLRFTSLPAPPEELWEPTDDYTAAVREYADQLRRIGDPRATPGLIDLVAGGADLKAFAYYLTSIKLISPKSPPPLFYESDFF
ncbi:hypothetical protein EBR96_00830 [bacterium]|nr:hypothetical protein [bacterium]